MTTKMISTRAFSTFAALMLLVQSITLAQVASAAPPAAAEMHAELAAARKATARYHDIDAAYADGFVDIGFFLDGVGCHLLNQGLLDDRFEAERPEILIYANCTPGQGGKAELRAIEYVTLCGGPPVCTLPAPEGFTGDSDFWTPFTDGSLWTLHVWVWRHNPDGIFTKVNPRLLE